MGKKTRAQRRGRGSSTFKSMTHHRISPSKYIHSSEKFENSTSGVVNSLLHEPGRGAPLAKIDFNDGSSIYTVAVESLTLGQEIEVGRKASPAVGCILPVGQISAGSFVCNIELHQGDGGKIAKASGTYASVIAHNDGRTMLKLPSGRSVNLDDRCLATLGIVSGGGRTDKPFVKAGKKSKWMKAKGRTYPTTKGVAMNAVSHPHGGGAHKSSSLKPTTVSRNAPPGQKVGLIAARQAGRHKRRTG